MPTAKRYVICRRASDPLAVGAVRGHFCRLCGLEIQVTPFGVPIIKAGGVPVCNPCGRAVAERHPGEFNVVESPTARAQSERMNFTSRSAAPPKDKSGFTGLYDLGTTVERLPSGKLSSFQTLGGRIPDYPARMTCDCCLAKVDRLWYYAHYGFSLRYLGWDRPPVADDCHTFLAGHWAFCVFCHALYLEGDARGLVARVRSLNPQLSLPDLEKVYECLGAVLHGEAHEWRSGQKAPGR